MTVRVRRALWERSKSKLSGKMTENKRINT